MNPSLRCEHVTISTKCFQNNPQRLWSLSPIALFALPRNESAYVLPDASKRIRRLLFQDEPLMAAFLCRANGRLAFVGITPSRVIVSPGLIHRPRADVVFGHDGYTKVE